MRTTHSESDQAALEQPLLGKEFIVNSLLPWYSCPEEHFPQRRRVRRREREKCVSTAGKTADVSVEQEKSGENVNENISDASEDGIHADVTTSSETQPAKSKSWSAVAKAHAPSPSSTHSSPRLHRAAEVQLQVQPTQTALTDFMKQFVPCIVKKTNIQPRGFVNTSNMCFMNSIFQALLYCVPFYVLMRNLGKKLPRLFRDKGSLLGSVITLTQEFRENWQPGEEEGDAYIPEVVYRVMKNNPRFDLVQTGEQEDAEEFLNLFLDEMHEEFVRTGNLEKASSPNADAVDKDKEDKEEEGWLEVGKKQKPVITRSATVSHSPITEIFGGQLRSVLKVPNARDSVLLEPYQPLPLDIQPDHIHSVLDAMDHLTTPETLKGWRSPKGHTVTATKQVFIEKLPAVLILHLKRFLYDDQAGGTLKNTKLISYPLRLEIPTRVISPGKRPLGPARYQLTAVVYHHGLSAQGGHYTVDVHQHDGSSWIRIDDTTIRTISESDVEVTENEATVNSSASSDRCAYLLFYTRCE
ncbi:ubiquitin carboxy terminal hydrolase Ubp3 [Schizosaccharomyces japonicus yFS275]|uniref:ubiquitinyl hydrolase 1 n=1 Tax=Schizosaccharomyces japonicus (strain yFS275 / FY16936) TaxID=402676 RepID=B6K2F1_SCHJY|nr:ubiquitin carboxy terminal hydrolase Ubp3 [Schizosaccharomyces japonicus yFS275]EEB07332.1 ubiquitin carboxy terminal hydrolase Ubp3 [Schizosaccharomyces japonicus yFS275]